MKWARVQSHGWLAVVPAVLISLALGACGGVRADMQPAQPARDTSARGSGGVNRPDHRDKPHLLLVSFDGFRPEYIEQFDLPNFRRVAQRGTLARAMIPVFPTLTFPNHFSLVTGLHPERHGIVANAFYDPARDETYALGDEGAVADGTWYRGEPIWVTAESQGMVAACFFWPGSEAAIQGVRPTFWTKFDSSIPNDDRVRQVLDWLRLPPEGRPHLITLYFSEVDSASHQGPLDSPAVEGAARSVDRTLGVLLDGLETLPIRDRIYLLLTSDHGMVETSAERRVLLDSLIDTEGVRVGFSGPVTSLHVSGGTAAARRIRDQLNARLERGRAYLRQEVPARLRFRADPRIGDVVVIMEESWTLASSAPSRNSDRERWGMHGWDSALPSMQALFLIAGPGIRAGTTIPEVENVDVYPLMAELLGLSPADGIDGRTGRIRELVSAHTAAAYGH